MLGCVGVGRDGTFSPVNVLKGEKDLTLQQSVKFDTSKYNIE